MNTSFQQRYAPLPLFFVAAAFILLCPVFWMGVEGAPGARAVGSSADAAFLSRELMPALEYGFGRLRRGDFPFWNDRQVCGTPFFAQPGHGLLQPLHLVFLFFDAPRALALHGFTALALTGFFMALLIRSLGGRYLPAVMGGVVWTCCGTTAAVMSRPAAMSALAWFPLFFLFLRMVVAGSGGLFPFFAGGIALAFIMVSCPPPLLGVLLCFSLVYTLCGAFLAAAPEDSTHAGRRLMRLSAPLGVFLIGALMSAGQWLPGVVLAWRLDAPGLFFGAFNVSGDAPEGARALLVQLLQAQPFSRPALAYLGVSTLLLLPVAFFHPLPRWERGFLGCAAALMAMVAALSGEVATVLWYPVAFCAALLAALGADRLFTVRRDAFSPRLWVPLALLAVVFVGMFLLAPATTRGRMLPVALALIIFALFRSRGAAAFSVLVITVFLFVDLSASLVNERVHPLFLSPSDYRLSLGLRTLLHETALDDRVLISANPSRDAIYAGTGMTDGPATVNGNPAALTVGQRQWWSRLQQQNGNACLDVSPESDSVALLNVMGVRAVAVTDEGGLASGVAVGIRLRRQGESDGVRVLTNDSVIPRLHWVSSWKFAADLNAAMDLLCAPGFDPREACVVGLDTGAVAELARLNPCPSDLMSETPKLTMTKDRAERVIVAAQTHCGGILVLSDSYDPDWRARVNGRPAPILQVNGLFRGIALPPGDHEVEFVYVPIAAYAGIICSGLTTGALLFGCLFLALRRLMIALERGKEEVAVSSAQIPRLRESGE